MSLWAGIVSFVAVLAGIATVWATWFGNGNQGRDKRRALPIMVAELISTPDRFQPVKFYQLVNKGGGVAFDVCCHDGDARDKSASQNCPVLWAAISPGEIVKTTKLIQCQSFTVKYKDSDKKELWTIVRREPAGAVRLEYLAKKRGKMRPV